VAVSRRAVDVVYLNVLARSHADTTSVIATIEDFVSYGWRNRSAIFRCWGHLLFRSLRLPAVFQCTRHVISLPHYSLHKTVAATIALLDFVVLREVMASAQYLNVCRVF